MHKKEMNFSPQERCCITLGEFVKSMNDRSWKIMSFVSCGLLGSMGIVAVLKHIVQPAGREKIFFLICEIFLGCCLDACGVCFLAVIYILGKFMKKIRDVCITSEG